LSIKLTDSNSTAISNETVKITIVDKKGKAVVNETVKTNSKGKAKLDLDLKKGKYNVTVTYGGNDNFTGSNTTQKLTIKEEEKVVEEPVSESSYSSSSSSYDSGDPNGLADKAEAAGISYTRSDSGEVFVNEAEYAEYAARTGDTW
uniref:Ig-like domain repeat protein n=1 Tax=Methanobrevibacter sp. TaxID=66852 RepID=UPI00386B5822